MATIALPRPLPPHRPSSSIASLSSALGIDTLEDQPEPCPPAVPNKHIPICPPGPVPQQDPATPPPSPGRREQGLQQSLLYPPTNFNRVSSVSAAVYEISAAQIAEALDHLSRQPLPAPAQVFPWLHGLHPLNHLQQSFFAARNRSARKTPCCLRGIALVKTDGDLSVSRLKGAISPHEFMHCSSVPEFQDVDPRDGFSVRNFQIQAAKSAMTSDVVVYGDDVHASRKMARDIAAAQQRWRDRHDVQGHPIPTYNTFLCTSSFREFEEKYPHLVAVDSDGLLTGHVLDFVHQERREMFIMTKPSEIAHNVWMGPTLDRGSDEDGLDAFDLSIECSDLGRLCPATLRDIAEGRVDGTQACLDFPSSGSILPSSWSHAEADGIVETCRWIYHLAHGTCPSPSDSENDEDGDAVMVNQAHQSSPRCRPHKILIHCGDGYTESTMLGIAYYSFSSGRSIPDAWLNLHTTLGRNFFAYPADVSLLTSIAPRLLSNSPALVAKTPSEIDALAADEPDWLPGLDGSFPSRILPYLYLGNLTHANNPELLSALGIGQLLSVGESAMWRDGELERWGPENVCAIQDVQDNGIDPLTDQFERCLEFIDRGRKNGTATLVHCRVGVSRSATICIAEVMRALDLSFPRAYCFVRARRLNVIIQPHLRFAYELLKWEETLRCRKSAEAGAAGLPVVKRELEWAEIAREIALMNRPYAR
ncbi:hypothetical protein M406DRAFT_276668 [Cryphonectria parasitica EP155]|uniref:Protein-tyrosine-phosphatase n=1 Tax=Cryphonectria parasitica (strain ATCC 38755 / EP155) TaxID=660469 RepID=A0A9P4Y3N3_CRYP1|nr:uncharacterized protein M406DRAFT_276668 [Cryphonectria parasitica EP155]KAF3765929.1 hypothetical protein M406DRAFT_276668 [Cryphonectria parasitica EP155]